MNQATLGLANKLLTRAQSTDFDAEAAALTERAYRLLADVLNDYDSEASSAGPPEGGSAGIYATGDQVLGRQFRVCLLGCPTPRRRTLATSNHRSKVRSI